MITRLDHIQLAMPPARESDARSFFSELLGLQEEQKPAALAARGGCWFRSGAVIVHIGVENEFVPQKKAHPAFCVIELGALCARLTAAGFPVLADEALPNRRRAYTEDPFGNRIELIQNGDGFSQM